jgi:hypothetical protein
MKIDNKTRRIVVFAGYGWCLADLLPPHPHFTHVDYIITALATVIYVMTFFIKEPNA